MKKSIKQKASAKNINFQRDRTVYPLSDRRKHTEARDSESYVERRLASRKKTLAPSRQRPTVTRDERYQDKGEGRRHVSRRGGSVPANDYRDSVDDQQALQPASHKKWFSGLEKIKGRVSDALPSRKRKSEHRTPRAKPPYVKYLLGVWGYYFVAKLVLFGLGLIAFHGFVNLIFAVFVLLPLADETMRKIRFLFAVIFSVGLLYYDSWLPSLGVVMSQASMISGFSFGYILDLITRFINLSVLAMLAAVWFVYWLALRKINMTVSVMVALLGVFIYTSPVGDYATQVLKGLGGIRSSAVEAAKPDRDQVLKRFFAEEALRVVSFSTPPAQSVPFDIIFIHICSLSWDDVSAVGLENHPLWKRFDYLFTQFNSAASYSGPAAIHLLRATCGQTTHQKLYSPVADHCYLMSSLLRSGFATEFALNHNGQYGGFINDVRTGGRLTAPLMPQEGLKVAQYAFDQSPVYDDLAVLDRWLAGRQGSHRSRVALYYNTITLHDGNHPVGTYSGSNTIKTYRARLLKFLDEMEAFMQKLDKSGRRAVIVMVPEHGAALRGDKRQISGLREIPTPAITTVPVGIKVIGGGVQREGPALIIDKPSSFLAISSILKGMLAISPFNNSTFVPAEYAVNLPTTQFVAQDASTTVEEYDHKFYLSHSPGHWEDYTEFDQPVATP
ncbi:MAG: cellulose biosynthesis protein BcsG [Gallionella sp.]